MSTRERVDRYQVTEANADVMLMPFSNAAKIQTKSLIYLKKKKNYFKLLLEKSFRVFVFGETPY